MSPFDKISHYHIYNDSKHKQDKSMMLNGVKTNLSSWYQNFNSSKFWLWISPKNSFLDTNQPALKSTEIKNSNESIFNKLDTERLLDEFKNRKPEDEIESQESDEGDCTSSDSEENFNDKELAKLLPKIKKKKHKSKPKHGSNRSQRQVSKGNNKDSSKAIGSSKSVSLY